MKNTDKYIGYTIEGEGLVDESVYIEGQGVYTAVVLNLRDYSNVVMLFEKGQTRELEPQIMVDFKGKVKELYKNEKNLSKQ